MADYQEGHVLTNKKTGDRVQLQDGQWVSIGPTVGTDIKRSTVPEFVRGAVNLANAPRAATDLVKRGIAYGTEKLGFEDTANRMRADIDKPGIKIPGTDIEVRPDAPLGMWANPQTVMNAVEHGIGGPEGMYTPKTTPGKYYGAVMQAAPGLAVGGGGTVPQLARQAVKTATGALTGEAAGQATEGSALSPLWRALGTFGGSAAPSIARRIATPQPTTPARIAQAQDVESRGVRLGSAQATGNPQFAPIEANMRNSTGGAAGMSDPAQAEAVSRALMRSTGAADQLPYLPAVRTQAARLARDRESLAANTHIPFDRALQTDVGAAVDRARRSLGLPAGAPVPGIAETQSRLFRDPATGQIRMGMPGPEYLEARSNLRTAGMSETSPASRQAHMDMRAALDRASERANPGFAQIHERMANARALERTMGTGSNEAVNGIAVPGTFHQQHSVPTAATPTFARNAQAMLAPPPASNMTGNAPAVLSAMAAAYLAHKYGWTGGPVESLIGGAVVGGPAGHFAVNNPATAAVATNPLAQAYLRNQAFRPSGDPLTKAEITARILAGNTPFRQGIDPEGYE